MPRRFVVLSVALVLLMVAVLVAVARDRWTDPTGDADVRDGVEEFLAPWYDALADHDKDPATVVVVGDSISEGVLLTPPVHEQRFVGLLQDGLREQVGAEGGAGYLPAYYGDAVTGDDTVRSGTDSFEMMFQSWGLGGRALAMPAGAVVTYPELSATRVRVWYGQTSLLGGEARVLVDGVDVTAEGTIEGDPSGPVLSSLGPADTSALSWISPPLEPGTHEVVVESLKPNHSFVHSGVEFLDGEEFDEDGQEAGVRVVDASHSGAKASDFISPEAIRGQWREVAARKPDLVVVNMGTNPEPDLRRNLERLVDNALAAAPAARVLLVDGYEPGTWTTQEWAEVRAAKRAVARDRPGRVAVFDLAAHWPVLAKDGSTNQGLMVEEVGPVHLTAEGNARMAEIFTQLLTPP